MNYNQRLFTRYRELLAKTNERRGQVDKLVNFLENETEWLTAPASTKFHLSKEAGLLEHSVGVTEMLLEIAKTLAPEIEIESLIIAGLFHDVGKVGYEDVPYYQTNPHYNSYKHPNRVPYTINKNIIAMSHASRSLYHVMKFINLEPDEAQAILYHDGPYIDGYRDVAMREEPLTLLLHFADLWQASQVEDYE